MSDLRNILSGAGKITRKGLIEELRSQGHYNTGRLEASFKSRTEVIGDVIREIGTAVNYAGILNDGTRPEKASMKQFPFLVQFFKSKGYDNKTARGYAAATIHKWMQEGMSTKKSARFSRTGRRLGFIEFVDQEVSDQINNEVFTQVDKVIDEEFNKQKSETI